MRLRRPKVLIHLKAGQTVVIRGDVTVRRSTLTGRIIHISWRDARGPTPAYLDVDEVAAVVFP